MKRVWLLVVVVGGLLSACQKERTAIDRPIAVRPAGLLLPRILPPKPVWPDSIRVPPLAKLPLKANLRLSRCIYSYDELIAVLGANKVPAKAVVLYGGPLGEITLGLSENLPTILYTVTPEVSGSSLFRSKLTVDWRPGPGVYFSRFTANVWSVGCVYEHAAVGPFTNLMKDGVIILVNTCFLWAAGEYAGLRIKYLVL